ncbi:FAD-dependent oxidoreductase [Meiothermus sp. CFH 77666]|uniref:NAD(P)/FAD-dependent oxidoreductase n=1 Tax=Meiothermus sp. CFH 77666 TaxID=2817942 RepID=UPI001AA04654|nr:FAD-dependent oxidoreductase [Meiothermus sp. CFH 77666]MBO1437899.1 FAD-dependent oxidoreductase [Meiothermus sp. CFH 77666]
MEHSPDVLIVGAGLAGLAAGRDLARAGLSVHMLDKSRGVSGRAATRWLELDGRIVRVDHGAQYFTAKNDPLRILIPDLVKHGIVREWAQGFPILRHNGIKSRTAGHPRYVCPDGMSTLGKVFLQGLESQDTPLPLETKSLVTGLHKSNEAGWKVWLEDGQVRSGRTLVLNMPAPQALELADKWLKPEVRIALQAVRYAPCWAAILVLERLPYLDWVGLEIEHPVLAWAALDHTKRAVPDPPVLVLHASAEWSQKHLELSPTEALSQIIEAARELFGDWVGQCRTAMAHRWRYALPTQTHPWPFLAQDNLVFCGDWCGGPRIEGALESGWAAAEYLIEYLKP